MIKFKSMYVPSQKVLENYARVMVDFALGKGKGIKSQDVVYIQYDLPAKPLALSVFKRVLVKGGYPILKSLDEDFEKIFFEISSDDQLSFFPKKFNRALVETIDHRLYLMAPDDPLFLSKIPPQKIILANKNRNILKKWLFKKEDQGRLTWSLCLYGTLGLAKQAKISLNVYWQEIIKACFLDYDNPVSKWRDVFGKIENWRNKLNKMEIDRIHILAKDTDFWIRLGEKRVWQGGRGANIPSFEIFTSPDWRGAEGKIFFDFPLYRYGNIIYGIYLEFKNGRVVKAKANKGEKLLLEMLKQKNADKIGEFSLTDKRLSRINRFMAHTLYDENFGGNWGNCHIALGSSYHDCFDGDKNKLKASDWEVLGFNDSVEHCDIFNTHEKRVEVVLKNGVKKIIYQDGLFHL